ncbi:hypothetical protein F4804DRAFT_314570 [Jackrogersella minutella]|nr:hypothetical protein F4804DRAFT_314570 [Jackrogersella minutella]
METEESRARFAELWGYHIGAVNPNLGSQASGGDPLSVDPLDTEVTWQWLNWIVNRCQRHQCSIKYCLRVYKKKLEEAREKGQPDPEPESVASSSRVVLGTPRAW